MDSSDAKPANGRDATDFSQDPSTLVERLEEENRQLRRQLDYTMSVAEANESVWRHFIEIERILFRARHLDELIDELLREIKIRFQLDQVILFVAHPDLMNRFFPDLSPEEAELIAENTWVAPLPSQVRRNLSTGALEPMLFSGKEMDRFRELVPGPVATMRSGAFIPVHIHEILFGALFLGSMDPERYRKEDGTDLLEQLGVKIALCMDNCITYEKLQDFTVPPGESFLLNFFQIHSVLEKEFWKAECYATPFSVLVIHLDFFDGADEEPGIQPEILDHVARLLESLFAEDEVYVGRYGIHELMILLPDIPESTAREVARSLAAEIRKAPFHHENTAYLIRSTIGAGAFHERMRRPYDLLDAACTDLYRHKTARGDS